MVHQEEEDMTTASTPTEPRTIDHLEGPLAGMRVLELGSLIAGPFTTRLLAEFGAEVIKIETPDGGDPLRSWRYVDRRTGTSLWWPLQSRNKKLITLNLKHPEGLALARRLAAESDILVENFRPGTLEKLGLGPEVLHELNPRLILVRVSGFGQTGPSRNQPGFGSVGEAMGGIRYITGEPGHPPVRSNMSLGDSIAALYAVIGTLMALRARDRLGKGQVVDVALYEAVFSLLESALPEYDVAGLIREPSGAALPGIAPSNTYRCSDGSYIVIGGNSDAIFKRLMHLMGRPELAEEPEYRTNKDRAEHAAELDALIESWTERYTLPEVLHRLEEAQIPAGPIYSIAEIVNDAQYRSREMVLPAQIEGIGTVAMPGLVPKLSETPGTIEWYGGEPGAHNEEVYCKLLGLSPEEMEQLSWQGVI
jgi:crotonobetainyl-CoA:carnitine CoA-transferase CaiB-like acyl-CoA transferase